MMGLRAGYKNDPAPYLYEYFSPREGFEFRGPEVDMSRPYGVCVGAAQTFGRFVQKPFPCLLSEKIGIPILNIGIGGAGPEDFIQPYTLEILGNAKFVVLQALSARSIDCSLYRHHGGSCFWRPTNRTINVIEAWQLIVEMGAEEIVLDEVRARWLSAYATLIAYCDCPVVALWMGKRGHKTDIVPSDDLMTAMCSFPQLVSPKNWRQLKGMCDSAVSLMTCKPIVFDRPIIIAGETEPVKENSYYPHPSEHVEVTRRIFRRLQQCGL